MKLDNGLQLDYLRVTLNLQENDNDFTNNNLLGKVIHCLVSLGVNISYNKVKGQKEYLHKSETNEYLCDMAMITKYRWIFSFWGKNSRFIYDKIQTKEFPVNTLNLKLTRIDLCFDRLGLVDKHELDIFFQSCIKKIPNHIQYKKTSRMLKIGSRKSKRCSRIYYRKSTHKLRFELEMKGLESIEFNRMMLSNDWANFENYSETKFLEYWRKYLPKTSILSSWFLDILRKKKISNRDLRLTLGVGYVSKEVDNIDVNDFLHYIRLLAFLRTQNPAKERVVLLDERYVYLEFGVSDWVQFCFNKESTLIKNQIQSAKQFLIHSLSKAQIEDPIVLQSISRTELRNVTVIPICTITKRNNKLKVKLAISETFLTAKFPFSLEKHFLNDLTDTHQEKMIKFKIVSAMLSMDYYKTLDLEDLLHSKHISGSTKKLRSHLIAQNLLALERDSKIHNKFQVEYISTCSDKNKRSKSNIILTKKFLKKEIPSLKTIIFEENL